METKEVKIQVPEGYEVDKVNSTFECIKFKKKTEVCIWEDIKCISGIYIDSSSKLITAHGCLRDYMDKNLFYSEKHAKASLALAQISQLMPYYGGEITDEEWENSDLKYCIGVRKNSIELYTTIRLKDLVVFRTKEQRDKFLSFPENVQLVKDLYMVD